MQINPAIPPLPPPENSHQLAWAIGAVVALVYFVSFWPRRHLALFNFKWMILAGMAGAAEYSIFQANGWSGYAEWGIVFFTVLLVYRARPSQSNRRISTGIRRRVIADWQRKTGEKFNARKYEIDHIVPFAKGGGHTYDNLRVIEKRKNRSKGARLPWWDILGKLIR